jgi:hypothetical protein
MQDTITMRLCDVCGEPATYNFNYGHGADDLCSACACQRGAEMNGVAEAAFRVMNHAIELLRESYVADDLIRRGFEGLLSPDVDLSESLDDFFGVVADVVGRDFPEDRKWARMYTPIVEAAA